MSLPEETLFSEDLWNFQCRYNCVHSDSPIGKSSAGYT